MAAPDGEPVVDPAQVDPSALAASLAHDQWCNTMRYTGWRYGPELDLPGLAHPHLVPWANLPDELRRDQTDQVRRETSR